MKSSVWTFTIILSLAAFASAADGPIDKGSFMLDGSIYFTMQSGELYEDPEGENYTAISIDPSVGYFVAPGLLLGADVGFSGSWQGDYRDVTGYYIGPSVGYYFNADPQRKQAKGAIYPFLKGLFRYARIKYTYYSDIELTVNDTKYGGEAGAIFMISNAVGLQVGGTLISTHVGIDANTSDIMYDESQTGLTFMFGAGITYFIY